MPLSGRFQARPHRNPWRYSYQPPGRGGRNYGWRNREGAHDKYFTPACVPPLIEPIHKYDHNTGQSITGGFVYRGRALGSSYVGRYFFADFVQGRVWSLALLIDPTTGEARASGIREHTAELSSSGRLGDISSFGVDGGGELYIVGYSAGVILKLLGPAVVPPTPSGLRIIRP